MLVSETGEDVAKVFAWSVNRTRGPGTKTQYISQYAIASPQKVDTR